MKTGRTIEALGLEITRQAQNKIDFVAGNKQLSVIASANSINLQAGNTAFPVRQVALRQIGSHHKIPAAYVDRCAQEAPELLAENLNHWLHASDDRRLVRVLDGDVRAYLSDRYQRIDNYDVWAHVEPILGELTGLTVRSCEITENRLYIKATTSSIVREVKSRRVGDFVEAGIIISNSEIGQGSVSVKPFANFLWCANGCARDELGRRWNHVGGRIGKSDEVVAYLTDETLQARDHASLLEVRDTVRACLDEVAFTKWVDKLNGLSEKRITGDVPKAIEILGQKIGLTQSEGASVLRHLIEGADVSQYGLLNAVTRTAEDAASYDRASEIEVLGNSVVNLAANDWRQIAEAA